MSTAALALVGAGLALASGLLVGWWLARHATEARPAAEPAPASSR